MVFAALSLPEMRIAVITITRNGALIGQKLRENLAGSELFVSDRYAGQAGKNRELFAPGELKELIARLWSSVDGFVMLMATGIVVRMVAPHLESKAVDPAVVVMDDAGKFAISLISGHLGGANELAEQCAFITGARAVITTATDANNLPSFDMLAKEQGWQIDDLAKVKLLNSLLLDGEEIAVIDFAGRVRSWFRGRCRLSFHDTLAKARVSGAAGLLVVSNRNIPPRNLPTNLLILRPRNLVLGIGCNRGTSQEEIDTFVSAQLRRILLSMKSVCCIATADAKRDEAGLLEFAHQLGVPLKCFESSELNQVDAPSPPSQYVMDAIGAFGVAEPAALLASGGGRLLLKKVKSENVTLAVAEMQVDNV
jgi:cobalt-precorrin 5A hydrolase